MPRELALAHLREQHAAAGFHKAYLSGSRGHLPEKCACLFVRQD
jgi:hypothetical protein